MKHANTVTTPPEHDLEPLLTIEELAQHLSVPVATIYDWRSRSVGPVAHRLGKHLRFAISDVQAWLGSHRDGGSR
jgi:excisionase family DNA binding protein